MPINEVLDFFIVDKNKGLPTKEVSIRAKQFGYNPGYVFNSNLQHLFNYSTLRNSKKINVAANKQVLGDIIYIKKGDIVPAKLRLIKVNNFTVDEEYITGNYAPTAKNTHITKDEHMGMSNMLIAGTKVISGSALAVEVGYDTPVRLHKHKLKQPKILDKNHFVLNQTIDFKKLKSIDAVVFNDLKNVHEITKSAQAIYMQKNITCIYLLESKVFNECKTALNEAFFNAKNINETGVYLYNCNQTPTTELISSIKTNYKAMYLSRGDSNPLESLFDINVVVAKDSLQHALQAADIVTEKVNYDSLASILYNKK